MTFGLWNVTSLIWSKGGGGDWAWKALSICKHDRLGPAHGSRSHGHLVSAQCWSPQFQKDKRRYNMYLLSGLVTYSSSRDSCSHRSKYNLVNLTSAVAKTTCPPVPLSEHMIEDACIATYCIIFNHGSWKPSAEPVYIYTLFFFDCSIICMNYSLFYLDVLSLNLNLTLDWEDMDSFSGFITASKSQCVKIRLQIYQKLLNACLIL